MQWIGFLFSDLSLLLCLCNKSSGDHHCPQCQARCRAWLPPPATWAQPASCSAAGAQLQGLSPVPGTPGFLPRLGDVAAIFPIAGPAGSKAGHLPEVHKDTHGCTGRWHSQSHRLPSQGLPPAALPHQAPYTQTQPAKHPRLDPGPLACLIGCLLAS